MRVPDSHPYSGMSEVDLRKQMQKMEFMCSGSTFTMPPGEHVHPWTPCITCLRCFVLHETQCKPGGAGLCDLLALSVDERRDLFPCIEHPVFVNMHPAYRASMGPVEKQATIDSSESWDEILPNDEKFISFLACH